MTVIRTASRSDLDAVLSLERAVFEMDAWSPRFVEEEFRAMSGDRRVVVAVDGPDLVGYAVLSFAGDTADVRRIAVDGTRRRRGIATRLLSNLLAAARADGRQRLLLEVAADNEPGLAFYARLGFAEIERRPRYYPGDVDAVVLQLRLGRAPGRDA